MNGEGGPNPPPVATSTPTSGCLGVLLLVAGLFAVFTAAEIAAFLIAASGRAPDNLSPMTAWAARSDRWWSGPFVALAPLLFLPIAVDEFEWARSPRALVDALKRVKPAAVWIGPAIFVLGLVALMMGGGGLVGFVLIGLIAVAAVGLGVLYLFGWATRAGFPQWAFLLAVGALAGAVSGVLSANPAATLACLPGAEISWRDGTRSPCAKILVFERREAHLVRRPDGGAVILPKSAADPASLRAAVGPRSIWFDEIKPAD